MSGDNASNELEQQSWMGSMLRC